MEENKTPARLRLVHPVYLDQPMMISFLAAVQGGVAFEDETTRRVLSAAEKEREAKGGVRASVPFLGSLFGFDAGGRVASKGHDEEAEEVKAIRQHTAASLFNALHSHLHAEGYIKQVVDLSDPPEVGDLVEITGSFVGNPLEQLLAFFVQAMPYFIEDEDPATEQASKPKGSGRSGNPHARARAQAQPVVEPDEDQAKGVRMIRMMQADLEKAPVHDTLIEAPSGLQVVLTMASEFFSETTNQYLRAGDFTALGKVTRVLGEDGEINLARRTVLGAAGSEMARKVVSSVESMEGLAGESGDVIIDGPAIQILPLAVYI